MRLLPRLPELEARLPGYALHLHPTLATPDFKRGEADAEIFYTIGARPTREGVVERELARPRVIPVASPALVGRLNRPAADLRLLYEVPWIHEISGDEWRAWLIAAGLPVDEQRLEGVRLWHAHLAVSAAELGQGVALANEFLVAEQLATGRLVEIGATDIRLGGYGVAMPAATAETEPMRALLEWLAEALPSQGLVPKRQQSSAN
jgi:DNA-binding transcriptional LysR family regulator